MGLMKYVCSYMRICRNAYSAKRLKFGKGWGPALVCRLNSGNWVSNKYCVWSTFQCHWLLALFPGGNEHGPLMGSNIGCRLLGYQTPQSMNLEQQAEDLPKNSVSISAPLRSAGQANMLWDSQPKPHTRTHTSVNVLTPFAVHMTFITTAS